MNNVEAKFILQGYRPNGADAADATFLAALEQTRADPALRDCFAQEQAFDAAISAKLGEIPPPAGLREAILAGGRVTPSDSTQRSWWRQPVLMVAASVAVLFAAGVAFWPKSVAANGAFTQFVLTDAMHSETHGGHGAEAGALQAALSQPTAHLSAGLPVNFAALRDGGCRTVNFEGHDVLEICFKRDGVWFHCYIAQRADFPALATTAPAVLDKNGASLAAWADASLFYMVVSKAGHSALERLL